MGRHQRLKIWARGLTALTERALVQIGLPGQRLEHLVRVVSFEEWIGVPVVEFVRLLVTRNDVRDLVHVLLKLLQLLLRVGIGGEQTARLWHAALIEVLLVQTIGRWRIQVAIYLS